MKRTEEYMGSGGKPVRVAAQTVADEWRKAHVTGCPVIPAQYAVATAERETNFAINESDTEPNGFISKGIFQISDAEAADIGLPGSDLLDLTVSCRVFLALQQKRLASILAHAPAQRDTPDVWAYLGLAHNEGLAACLHTIANYGLSWKRYKQRNHACEAHQSVRQPGHDTCMGGVCGDYIARIGRYGDSCITGGSHWPGVTA